MCENSFGFHGRASSGSQLLSQAVRCWLLTPQSGVQSLITSCEIYDWRNITGAGFPLLIITSPILLTHLSPPHNQCNALTRQHIVIPFNFKFGSLSVARQMAGYTVSKLVTFHLLRLVGHISVWLCVFFHLPNNRSVYSFMCIPFLLILPNPVHPLTQAHTSQPQPQIHIWYSRLDPQSVSRRPQPYPQDKISIWRVFFHFMHFILRQKELRGFSPPANYTDRATAAFWRS
jgi:hypothetical protein